MPIYTYECEKGHRWDEIRSAAGDTQGSADPCPTCLEADRNTPGAFIPYGAKVPSSGVSARFKGQGWTPKFYPGRKSK